ncbi:hypothetical protein V8F20_011142 [Naviculisporaceae sp. PSN 640]
MSSRKGHNKSRHGCLRCKERRVKCNEIGPCNHCVRRREECSLAPNSSHRYPYPSLSNRSSPGSSYSPSPESSTSFLTPFIRYGSSHDSSWSQDLYLMSHFLLSSCKTITSRPDLIHMWQHVVPKDAVSQPFLMHGVLAFAALHLASLNSHDPAVRLQYARLSQHHQSEAIPEFRRALSSLSPESAGPCFAMGSILACLAVAGVSDNRLDLLLEEGDIDSSSSPMTFETILSIFTLIRGIRGILSPAWAWDTFSTSPYIVAVHGHTVVDYDTFELPDPLRSAYGEARQRVETSALSGTEKKACLEALDEREKVEKDLRYQGNDQQNLEQSFLFKWVAVVSDDFVSLLTAKNPVAAEILRGFVLLIDLIRDVDLDDWYLKGFKENALGVIDSHC